MFAAASLVIALPFLLFASRYRKVVHIEKIVERHGGTIHCDLFLPKFAIKTARKCLPAACLSFLESDPEWIHVEEDRDIAVDEINDVFISRICEFNSIRDLSINSAHITDSGVLQIAGMASLENLYIGSPQITDAGISSLEQLPALRELWIDDANCSPASIEWIAKSKSLRTLGFVNNRRIDDAFVAALKIPDSLDHLCLTGTAVTGGCVESVVKYRHLQHISLDRTDVNNRDVLRLRMLRPALKITWSY